MPDPFDAKTRAQASATRSRRTLLALLLLGLVLGFAFQGSRGLWSPDEGRYVDGAVQMLDSGNWLAPAYSPERLNFSKPPVTYWLIASSLKVFGRNTWAARTPYALAFVATLLLLYGMGRTLVPDRPWLPALVYALAPLPFLAANGVSTDAFLALFEALAMLGFVRAAFGAETKPPLHWIVLMWCGFGLAFLTKGPPGLIPLLGVLPFIQRRDGWRGLGRYFHPVGLAVFLVVGGAWYVLAMQRYPWLLHYFLHREVYDRMFTAVQRRHPGPFGWIVAYVPTLVIGSLPWWPMLLGRKARSALADAWREVRARRDSPGRFLLLWLLLPLLVFCLVQSRLPLYILPLFVPLSLLLARALRDHVDLRSTRQRWVLGLWFVALLAIKASLAWFVHLPTDDRATAGQLAALGKGHAYGAITFVQDTAQDYAIEERTPWGLHLYLGKPIYGVAWHKPQAAARLCQLVRTHGPMMLVLDPTLRPAVIEGAVSACGLHIASLPDRWRRGALFLAGR
ncbi:glycosyltransferase family 39 protein [Dyella sp. A6]|uniref:ArnT family glycosyltransferase n=1 Tax=Dyella aluminiiresistens TaxID=3069105 RepID=UPI002E778CC8|nr:glycosyltransferase family 39 protein [Dyella sp. A6]